MEAKEEFNKEQIKEKRKKREANIDEIISLAQCQVVNYFSKGQNEN